VKVQVLSSAPFEADYFIVRRIWQEITMRRTGIAAKVLIGAATLGAAPSAHAAEREPLRETDKVAICAESLEELGGHAVASYVKALPAECKPFSDYFPEGYRIISPAQFLSIKQLKAGPRRENNEDRPILTSEEAEKTLIVLGGTLLVVIGAFGLLITTPLDTRGRNKVN
jgi:hypothetical protein